jgi:hypothetical protein
MSPPPTFANAAEAMTSMATPNTLHFFTIYSSFAVRNPTSPAIFDQNNTCSFRRGNLVARRRTKGVRTASGAETKPETAFYCSILMPLVTA